MLCAFWLQYQVAPADYWDPERQKNQKTSISNFLLWNIYIFPEQGGEGRVSKAENLRSPREIQSIFNLLGRYGKN